MNSGYVVWDNLQDEMYIIISIDMQHLPKNCTYEIVN